MSTDASWLESMPAVYDRCLGPVLFAPFGVHLAQLAAALSPDRVLELAAGTGIATAELVRALPAAEITATDLNAGMVSWGAQRVTGPTWRQADAQRLDLPDASFDLVVCQFGVMFLPDKPAAIAEAARVLRPGGTFLFSVWDVVQASPLTAAVVECCRELFPEDPPDFIVRVPHGYTDPARIQADVEAGGLVPVSLDRVVLRGAAPSAASLVEGFCKGTPLRFELEQRGPLDVLTERIERLMIARLGPGPVQGDLAALVVTARKPR